MAIPGEPQDPLGPQTPSVPKIYDQAPPAEQPTQRLKYINGKYRYQDPVTGAMKEMRLVRPSLIPAYPLWEVAYVFGRGSIKYEPENWRKGYPWSLSVDSLERHLTSWKMGEDVDPDTGSLHLAQVCWHALVLIEFSQTHPNLDDRVKGAADDRARTETVDPNLDL